MKNVAINRKQVHLVGGSVTLLRNKIIKDIEGGSLSANKIIGIISPAPSNERVLSGGDIPIRRRGGDLLNHISFGKNVKNNNRDNVRFLF